MGRRGGGDEEGLNGESEVVAKLLALGGLGSEVFGWAAPGRQDLAGKRKEVT